MEQAKGLWVDELHAMLWTYHTIPHSSTQETPYRLVYGVDAIIPINLSESSPRTITMTKESNELARRAQLDLVKEDRVKAKVKVEAIKQQMVINIIRRSAYKNLRKGTWS